MTLQLEISGPAAPFSFDVPGLFEPRLEPSWKAASNPPQVTEVREVWEIRGARLVSPDGSQAALWARWTEFTNQLRKRAGPQWVRLVRDPKGAREIVWTLGPPTHEGLKIEQLSAGQDESAPSATWKVLASVTLIVSGVRRFQDVRGIVGWEQDVSSTFTPGGLHVLEWRTEITTREGVSALERARRLGRIDVRPFGDRYSYDTNGPDGVEVTALDADEASARVPTVALAVSRIHQWGVPVGALGPGTSPTEVGYSTRRKVEKGEAVLVVRASARGPSALRWVELREPPGAKKSSEIFHEEAVHFAEGVWTFQEDPEEEEPDSPTPNLLELRLTLSGGHADFDFEPVVGGYEPVTFEGALLPWKLTAQIKVRKRGGEGKPGELLLPGVLAEPWLLDRKVSHETLPYLAEPSDEPDARLWARDAALVYWSARRPDRYPSAELKDVQPVESYWLSGARS